MRYTQKMQKACDETYAKAERLGITGFDIDVELTPEQNLDMALAGFSPQEGNECRWNIENPE